jgi:hypothetical protein
MTTIAGINPFFPLNTGSSGAIDAVQTAEQRVNPFSSTQVGGGSAPQTGFGTNVPVGFSRAPAFSFEAYSALINSQAQGAPPSQAAPGTEDNTSSAPSGTSSIPPGLVATKLGDPDDNLLPTPANLQKYSGELTQSVNALLAQAGISQSPPISFSVDPNTAQVAVTGNRPDTAQIQKLINSDPGLKSQFHQVQAAGSQLAAFQQGLKAVDAYLAAKTPAEIQSVIGQYYSGGPSQSPDITLAYDGTSIQVDANGQPLLSS